MDFHDLFALAWAALICMAIGTVNAALLFPVLFCLASVLSAMLRGYAEGAIQAVLRRFGGGR